MGDDIEGLDALSKYLDGLWEASMRQTIGVYKAQQATFYGKDAVSGNDEIESEELKRVYSLQPAFNATSELTKYGESIRKSEFVKKNWPRAYDKRAPKYTIGIPVGQENIDHPGAGTDMLSRTLTFSRNGFALNKESVIHELSHLIQADQFGLDSTMKDDRQGGHGGVFARINVMLVGEFIGKDTGELLEKNMMNYGAVVASVDEAVYRGMMSPFKGGKK